MDQRGLVQQKFAVQFQAASAIAALEFQPDLAEALIKKAAALEKLERMDDAIACYDRAIEAEDSATTALLQKGGLLNRLARYEEALQCYERALRTQEKKAASV